MRRSNTSYAGGSSGSPEGEPPSSCAAEKARRCWPDAICSPWTLDVARPSAAVPMPLLEAQYSRRLITGQHCRSRVASRCELAGPSRDKTARSLDAKARDAIFNRIVNRIVGCQAASLRRSVKKRKERPPRGNGQQPPLLFLCLLVK
jgi:hypothetical protein